MADQFTLELHQNLKPNSFSAGINSNMELLDNMSSALENLNSNPNNLHGFMPLSNDNFSDHHQRHHHLPFMAFEDSNIQSPFHTDDHQAQFYDPIPHFLPMVPEVPNLGVESLANSNPHVFGSGFLGENKTNRNYGYGGKKRKRNNEREAEKPREVVHVRARRGEATDSHSLAERLRREKINEKLRCLQDLVPGCYKTMGMSVMLDVIINYVRSLQNQIEFLSMKLSAASMFYDFNSSEMEALDTMKGTNGYETQAMVGEGYGVGLPQFQSTWPL